MLMNKFATRGRADAETRRRGEIETGRSSISSKMLSRYKFILVLRNTSPRHRIAASPRLLFILGILVFSVGCRYDMQDQPRYKAYKKSEFHTDGRASRELPDGTVPRGFLRADKALYTGKKDGVAVTTNVPAPTVDASGTTIVTSFPNDVEEFPVPVTKELIDRGQQRYNIYCVVCHGPTGSADGMIVRRGFPKPPTYHDDRLRNAPVGHFFDVITNGWGKMNSYASQVPVADRWAIIAYIRALQLSQNPHGMKPMPMAPISKESTASANANTAGGIRH